MLVVLPVIVTYVAVLIANFFPRAPTWQIRGQKYTSVSFNYDFTMAAEMELELELYNDNLLSAHVNAIELEVLHRDAWGVERPFARIHVAGDFALPARGSVRRAGTMVMDALAPAMAGALARDAAANGGTLVTRAHSTMDVSVLGGAARARLEAECVQHLRADAFPMEVTYIDCRYYMGRHRVPMLPTPVR
ncbi:hypothetical protein JKP88DRAFT_233076 [Tribonema minus]|uniref:Late embryogenesis abundant protein LEA-2 subgroup domain-containing protein n=1 Tax=Tribonema minus TaxID=303371 RepID=A0A836CLA5_9STRA|nr:hypothetical protein JKP88DRAFT_233076 [Tribonema minus]